MVKELKSSKGKSIAKKETKASKSTNLENGAVIMEVFASVLLGIALQEFFSIITQNIQHNYQFFITMGIIASTYIALIFVLISTHPTLFRHLIMRILVIMLFSSIPYVFQRAYGNLVNIDRLGLIGISLTLVLSSVLLLIWPFVEKFENKLFSYITFIFGIVTLIFYLFLIFGINFFG